MRKRKIRKDDEVIVLTGRDKGKRGAVLRVVTRTDRVLVEGVNVTKRHVKPTQADPQGGIVEREAPVHISNVALIDPESDRPTRVRYKTLEDGRKVRVAARSGEVIDV
ncbi:MAG: 50S ribosomal protein L24 [Rhodospirillales bacterium]|nr:50S ribosomal protein L24 [Rhodospirillales bacterium]MDE0378772.1 50S ribosomal protein L24 [Rhodospirillales bacterium]MDE0392138.1 50S ribosomal protein L24 [Rhodospirillales bacterium]